MRKPHNYKGFFCHGNVIMLINKSADFLYFYNTYTQKKLVSTQNTLARDLQTNIFYLLRHQFSCQMTSMLKPKVYDSRNQINHFKQK